jgi:transposase-like protein
VQEDYPKTILELERRLATEDACREYLFRLRWPNGFVCPRCQGGSAWTASRGRLVCRSCRHQTSVTKDVLHDFARAMIERGSFVHTDGLMAWKGLQKLGYRHKPTVLLGRKDKNAASRLLPRVHRVASLLKRWLLGTHQGAVEPAHLDYYLDEFTFRFNRRTSRSRGKLFYRLLQQAVEIPPTTYRQIIGGRPTERNE